MPITLSCLNHVKRHLTGPASKKNQRPPAPTLYTDVSWCGDRSGSMSSMGLSPQEGAETFMKDHKKLSNKIKPMNGSTTRYAKKAISTIKGFLGTLLFSVSFDWLRTPSIPNKRRADYNTTHPVVISQGNNVGPGVPGTLRLGSPTVNKP